MPDIYLRTLEATASDVRLKDPSATDSVTVTGTADVVDALDSASASALEVFRATADVVDALDATSASALEVARGTAAVTDALDAGAVGALQVFRGPSAGTDTLDAVAAVAREVFRATATLTDALDAASALAATTLRGTAAPTDGLDRVDMQGAVASRRGRPRQYPVEAPVVAESLYKDLIERYGAYDGKQVYFGMRREQKGPFAPGNKYEADGRRAQVETVPVRKRPKRLIRV